MQDNTAKPNKSESVPSTRRNSRYYTQIEPIIADPVLRGYFTLIASFLLTAFFILFALSPTFSTIVGLVRKIDDQKKIISSLDAKITNLITAQENYSQIEPKIPLLETALPTKPIPEQILDELVKTSTASGVNITTIQINEVYLSGVNPVKIEAGPKAPPEKNNQDLFAPLGLPLVRFTVGVKGQQANIRDFIGQIVNLPRILLLDEFALTTETGSVNRDGTLNAKISGSGFFYPNIKAKKIVETKQP